jgi:hypothetical protein
MYRHQRHRNRAVKSKLPSSTLREGRSEVGALMKAVVVIFDIFGWRTLEDAK